MNAAEQARSVELAQLIASALNQFRQRFPELKPNLRPWRDDPETRQWTEQESLDLAFHFPGWSPRLQCRSLLLELRLQGDPRQCSSPLLGVVMRGMTYDGERWRLATVGDWQPSGSHLPQPEQVMQLQQICRDLHALFGAAS